MTGVTLYAPGAGEEVRATHVAQFVNLMTGAAGGGALVKLNEVSDSASYSVTAGNQDTTNGYALKVQYGPLATPTTLATFQKSSSRIQSPSGSQYIDISNTGITITGSLSLNSQLIGSGVKVFNVLDYGILPSTVAVEASAGTSVRAANNVAFATLMNALAAAGGGDIEFPPHPVNGFYPFVAPLTMAHTTGGPISIRLRGHGQSSTIQCFSVTATNPGLDFAGTGTSPWRQSAARDLVIQADSAVLPTGGALIRLQTVSGFDLENLWLRAAWSGIEIGAGSLAGLVGNAVIPQLVRIRNVDVDLRASSAGDGLKLNSAAGVWLKDSTVDGDALLSTGLRVAPAGTSVAASTYNAFDSLWVDNCNFNGHQIGVRLGTIGQASNLFFSRTHLDGNGVAGSLGIAMQIDLAAGTVVQNVQLSDMWMALYASSISYGLLVSGINAPVSNILVTNSYITGAKSAAISVTGSVTNVANITINGCLVAGQTLPGNNEIDIQGGKGIIVIGNQVAAGSNAGYGIFVQTTVANLLVNGNITSGKSSGWGFGGTTSSTRVFANNVAG